MYRIINLAAIFTFLSAAAVQAAPLSLRDCLTRAAAANTVLKVATYDEKIADENIRVSESGYLPKIDVQAGFVAQLAPQAVNLGPKPIETQEADFGYFNLSIYETLYDFGRTSARREQATLTTEALHHSYRGQEQEIFLQVVQAFYGILEGRKILTAADEEVKQMTDHQRVAQNLFDQGVVTRNDLLQAGVRLANSKQKRLAEANRLENGWLYLNYLTGQPAGYRAEMEEQPERDEAAELNILLDIAMRKRPEISALKKSVQANEAAVRENRSSYYPELFAKLGLDYVQNNKVQEQAIMSATIGLKINLFDGLATTSRLRQAVKIRDREEERLRNLEIKIGFELQAALNDLHVAEQRIAVTEKAIKQSEENLRINNDRYLEKVGTATEVLDAQTLLTQTRTEYFRSVFDYQVASARVKKAIGEL